MTRGSSSPTDASAWLKGVQIEAGKVFAIEEKELSRLLSLERVALWWAPAEKSRSGSNLLQKIRNLVTLTP